MLLAAIPSYAQIENGGFEYWETNSNGNEEPTGWTCDFYPGVLEDLPAPFEKDPDAYTGSYAITLKNIVEIEEDGNNSEIIGIYGYLMLGKFNFETDKLVGQAINERPIAISGYYKFNQGAPLDSDIYDTAKIDVALSKWNPAHNVSDSLVTASLKIFETKTEYTKFTLNLNYDDGAIPDTLIIMISTGPESHSGFNGTTFTIDDLSYTTVTGLSHPISRLYSGKTYPNPATIEVNFKDLPSESRLIVVKDLSGKMVKTLSLTSDNINLETSELNSGMYLYTVLDSEENVLYTGKLNIKK
ncbi:hypothetical protein MYP_1729 [Sporocytophaga myxococcoides]|uniref:Secretion system C-terminal sorting domain-containing protein n=2 Tax=Sporocytophaga myxococcoides TaxID=153721 RepID=A0A098LC30_9BACT|nr:hypothetical protein MYP_1729 [Sporocytophaga myxococcoides]